jgi:hypothetical protein
MGAWAELREGIRKMILMQDRLERLSAGAEKMAGQLVELKTALSSMLRGLRERERCTQAQFAASIGSIRSR